jgi:hypothetical protein
MVIAVHVGCGYSLLRFRTPAGAARTIPHVDSPFYEFSMKLRNLAPLAEQILHNYNSQTKLIRLKLVSIDSAVLTS